MKKAVKYLAILILGLLTALCVCAGLSACSQNGAGNGGGGDTNSYGKWSEYDGVKIAFADEATYNDGELDESKVLPELNCLLTEKYYMLLDFDIQAPYDNDGRETVTAEVRVQPAAAVKATIQDTNTGTTSNETQDDITTIKATYKIPEKAETVRNMRLVIQVEALKGSEVYIDTSFKSSGEMQAVKTEKVEKAAITGYTEELTFSDGTVTGISDKSITEVVIPIMKGGTYIAGIGKQAFFNSNLTNITIPNSVTSIGWGAFSGCSKLTSLAIPDGVTDIGSGLFENCRGLRNIIIPDSVISIGNYVFRDCSSLISISVPDGVTSIGWSAFEGCSSLTSITIPNAVTEIGNGAFRDCSGLESIIVSKDNTNYKSENNCLLSKDGKTLILGCRNSIVPNSVTSIGVYSFSGCSSLISISVPDGVTYIGGLAFSGCSSLISISVPDGVTSIGWSAFEGCSSLTSITIPNAVTEIGDGAFRGCSALESIIVDKDNANYKSENNCLLSKNGKNLILGCKNSTIPNGVTSIRDYAFYGCKELISITVTNNVTNIGYYAFKGCIKLTSITIPNRVTSIGLGAFGGCNSLTNIIFNGTMAQWKAIKKGNGWDSGTGGYNVRCYIVQCTDGKLDKDGKVIE